MKGLGQRIKERRIKLGWTQERLAQESGFSRVYIIKIENGRAENPGIKTLSKIGNCLGIKLSLLCK